MYILTTNNELYHHGIKGQKWGVRRFQNSNGSLTTAGKKRYSGKEKHSDYTESHSKKHVSQMSDAELRKRINRLQMEKQYKDLEPSVKNAGKEYLGKALKVLGTVTVATTTLINLMSNFDKLSKVNLTPGLDKIKFSHIS